MKSTLTLNGANLVCSIGAVMLALNYPSAPGYAIFLAIYTAISIDREDQK